MRGKRMLAALLGVLLIGTTPVAAAEEQARAIVTRAIEAHGGEKALLRAQTRAQDAVGTQFQQGKKVPFTSATILSLPDRFRVTGTLDRRIRFVLTVSGDRGWELAGGSARPLGKERLQELRDEARMWWLATLVPLTRPGFTLTVLPEARVQDRPTQVLRVSARGQKDCKLFFDKASGLLVRIERRATEAGAEGDRACDLGDHQSFDGAQLPTREKHWINGKPFLELNLKYRLLSRVEDRTFGKP